MSCLNCGAETTNGLALCEPCRTTATVDLEFLPVYFRNLTRWRPGRSGSRGVPESREPRRLGGGGDDRVSRALDEVGSDVATWARCLADDRGVELPEQGEEAETFATLCDLLTANLTSIATLEWAGEMVRKTGEHERRLRAYTEQVAPGWYAGECRRCKFHTYVVPGLTWVTCGGCGATTYARDHLDTVIDEARAWVARPMRLAEAAVAMIDTEVSIPRLHKRISKWGEREEIQQYRATPYAPKKFRFGEVLDRLFTEGATRPDTTVGANVDAEAS